MFCEFTDTFFILTFPTKKKTRVLQLISMNYIDIPIYFYHFADWIELNYEIMNEWRLSSHRFNQPWWHYIKKHVWTDRIEDSKAILTTRIFHYKKSDSFWDSERLCWTSNWIEIERKKNSIDERVIRSNTNSKVNQLKEENGIVLIVRWRDIDDKVDRRNITKRKKGWSDLNWLK